MIEPSSESGDFRRVFPIAVEAGLTETVGESAMKVMLSRFPDIATSAEKLDQVLSEIFGEGAKVLRDSIFNHMTRHDNL